jgi:hypothetical protein
VRELGRWGRNGDGEVVHTSFEHAGVTAGRWWREISLIDEEQIVGPSEGLPSYSFSGDEW